MNEVIKITQNENQDPIVSGRDLHEFLEIIRDTTIGFIE